MPHNALDRAKKEKLILSNPAEDRIIPKPKKQEFPISVSRIRAYVCNDGAAQRVDAKTVSSMSGHYDAGFTLRTYIHTIRKAQNDAAEKLERFMTQVM